MSKPNRGTPCKDYRKTTHRLIQIPETNSLTSNFIATHIKTPGNFNLKKITIITSNLIILIFF